MGTKGIGWSKTKQKLLNRSPFFPARGWSENKNAPRGEICGSDVENWLKLTFLFLVFFQLQKPKDTGTGRECDRLEPADSQHSLDKDLDKKKGGVRGGKLLLSQPELSLEVSSPKPVPSQVLPRLKGWKNQSD